MFNNVGKKIQGIAKAFFIADIVVSVIAGIGVLFAALVEDEELFCMCIFIVPIGVAISCFIAWIIALLICGFGKLVEDVGAIRGKGETLNVEKTQTYPSMAQQKNATAKPNVAKTQPVAPQPKPVANKPELAQSPIQKDEKKELPCPECGEELAFMGWSDEELKEKQECPMCKKEIILK